MSRTLMLIGAILVISQVFRLHPSWVLSTTGLIVAAIGALLFLEQKEAEHVRNGDR